MPNPGSPPSPGAPLRLGDFLPYRLSVLSNTVSSAIAETYGQRFGLTIWQWRCMAVIAEAPGLTARDVAARTAMDKVAVSRALAGLEADRRVAREADPQDRRASRLRLTPDGERVYAQIVPIALEHETELLAGLSDSDRATLLDLLDRLADAARRGGPSLW